MPVYEYKVVEGPTKRMWLMPWASAQARELFRKAELECKLNELSQDGWELVSFGVANAGNFVWLAPQGVALLRRPLSAGADLDGGDQHVSPMGT